MKILITGSNGFIARNLSATLAEDPNNIIYKYDRNNSLHDLIKFTKDCDVVFHLAGVNRPLNNIEFYKDNLDLTQDLIQSLKINNNKCNIVVTSSIQAKLNNDYGKSKLLAEKALFKFSEEAGNKVIVFRLKNMFGKWSRPNYNSVVATFCFNISHDLDVVIDESCKIIELCYIDDLVIELLNCLNGQETYDGPYAIVPETYPISLYDLSMIIHSFKDLRCSGRIVETSLDNLSGKLYSTYLSYLDESDFKYKLNMNIDNRGSFTEFLKFGKCGQISVNISKKNITKGDHWHHSKNEKFLVVSGKAIIRFRQIESEKITEYNVSGEELEVVDIPVGYTHNIENIGNDDLITIMWANEEFDTNKPDTFFLKV